MTHKIRRLAAAALVVLPFLAIACTSDNTACGLLRRDEIERLTGSDTGPGTPEIIGDSTNCEWRGEFRSLLLVVHEGDRLESYRAEARSEADGRRCLRMASVTQTPPIDATPTPARRSAWPTKFTGSVLAGTVASR